MQLSETIKLYPTKEQKAILKATMAEYIHTVNDLVDRHRKGSSIKKYTSADVTASLPSALKNQCIRDAKSVVKKYEKNKRAVDLKNEVLKEKGLPEKEATLPVLRKLCFYVNNQNYKVHGSKLEFPVFLEEKTTRLSIETKMTDRQKEIVSQFKLGTMRVVCKGDTLVAQIVYTKNEKASADKGNSMGVDLGIKCPAVSYTSDGSVRFYGNGRQNKYIRRHFKCLRQKLQKEKNRKAIRQINNKEQRIMRDIDHKISRAIVNTAIEHKVSTIKIERLTNIRSTTRKSRKNNPSLHQWSFYRLASFIEYKARMAGIAVEYMNPAYTSQTCPICGTKNHAKDRDYRCSCGFHTHRDILGARNLCYSTEYVGGEYPRHTA